MTQAFSTWEAYFEPGEKLIWQGAPVVVFFPGWLGVFLSAFGMPFFLAGWTMMAGAVLGLAMEWDGMPDVAGRIYLFFFSIPFAAVGTGLVLGPWAYGPWAARHIRYALSDKRAYIAQRFFGRKMKSYPIGPSDAIEIEQGRRADSVKFHVHIGRDSDGDKTTERVGFDNIVDGEEVYHLIRKIQRGGT